ncbi:MAG: hypothetical protein C0603_13340 [Denitrovibrio sp.]|nr:MAG: hypothetical protein C0603_13340 [Denitrovibrio sp.]
MSKLLRDVFNIEAIKGLTDRLKSAYSPLNSDLFYKDATSDLSELDYGERIELITDAIHKHLPKDYDTAVTILLNSLPPAIEATGDFKFQSRDFINLPHCRYISKFGLDNFDLSINALKEMTSRFTSEYDMRYIIEKYPQESIALIKTWVNHENLHIRRLASEGTRPRLPMGKRLQIFVKDPSPILPILEALKNDESLYVRRSVANSLNDISKDHPDLAADIAEQWLKEDFEHAKWVCNHAMRSLFKAGHVKALAISGYPEPKGVEVWGIDIKDTTLQVGDDLQFSFVVDNNSEEDINLMIDFELILLKNNKKYSPKVFKLKKTILKSGKKLKLFAKHPFRERTTRKYYSGKQYVRVVINGERQAPVQFYLHQG